MTFKKRAKRYLILALAWSLFLLFLSLQPAAEVEKFLPFDLLASLAHAAVYFVLAALLCLALRFWKYGLLSIALISFIYALTWGIANELAQFCEPTRCPGISDVISDAVGAALAITLFIWWRNKK
ncbi:MAG: VanZ family protein [bacterium]|nr:VanZ family protein [bacterium]MDD5354547.1 VanZ family protein [bacterium]